MLFVAVATSFLAGWGLIGSSASQLSGSPIATPTTSSWSSIPSSTTSQSSTQSSATVSNTVTSSVAAGSTTTLTTTNATSGGYGYVAGNSISSTTTAQNSGALASLSTLGAAGSPGESLLREVQTTSLFLAPVSWVLLGGAWVWRGRVRARYSEMGFGSDVFELFMKMKGGATRIKVLNTLSTPKDRLQLAQELGVDWKTVDRHVQILNKYGFVTEQAAYGTVRLYEVTPLGKMLLNLFDDLERTDGPVAQQPPAQEERHSGS